MLSHAKGWKDYLGFVCDDSFLAVLLMSPLLILIGIPIANAGNTEEVLQGKEPAQQETLEPLFSGLETIGTRDGSTAQDIAQEMGHGVI